MLLIVVFLVRGSASGPAARRPRTVLYRPFLASSRRFVQPHADAVGNAVRDGRLCPDRDTAGYSLRGLLPLLRAAGRGAALSEADRAARRHSFRGLWILGARGARPADRSNTPAWTEPAGGHRDPHDHDPPHHRVDGRRQPHQRASTILTWGGCVGASRWATIRGVVFPAAKSGLFTGVILETGRAIGETMAILMVCGNVVQTPSQRLRPDTDADRQYRAGDGLCPRRPSRCVVCQWPGLDGDDRGACRSRRTGSVAEESMAETLERHHDRRELARIGPWCGARRRSSPPSSAGSWRHPLARYESNLMDVSDGPPRNAGREGGIGPILVSTALILGVCLGVSSSHRRRHRGVAGRVHHGRQSLRPADPPQPRCAVGCAVDRLRALRQRLLLQDAGARLLDPVRWSDAGLHGAADPHPFDGGRVPRCADRLPALRRRPGALADDDAGRISCCRRPCRGSWSVWCWGWAGPLRKRPRSSSRAAMWTACRSRCSIPAGRCPSTSSTSR